MEETPRKRRIRRIAIGAGVLVLATWMASALGVLWYASHDRARNADAIVVLGAAHYLGRPSPVLRARLEHARALHARGIAPVIVLTGGTAEGDTASEAEVSRVYLVRRGVPDSVLLTEQQGRTTAQSIEAAAVLLRARGMKRVVIVSDPFHVFRAAMVAEAEGLDARTSPTRTDSVWTRVARAPGYFLSESVKTPLALVVR